MYQILQNFVYKSLIVFNLKLSFYVNLNKLLLVILQKLSHMNDKQKKKLIDFENLLCKQQSKQSDRALKQLLKSDPLLNEQYLSLLSSKNRLPLITFSILTYPPSKPTTLKLLMHVLQHLPQLPPKQVTELYKSLYFQYPVHQSNRYQLFYESLSTFCFGGVNRKSQSTSLQVILQLFNAMRERKDNQLLIGAVQDFTRNFMKFRVLEVGYVRTMNGVLAMREVGLECDVFAMVNRYLRYIDETKKKQAMHELQSELLYGLEEMAMRVLDGAYLIGSIHQQVLEAIEELLKDNVFVVRNAARKTILAWNKVQQRYQLQVQDKQIKFNINADMQDLIEQRVLQNENQSKIMKYIDRTQKYALVQEVNQKKAMNKFVDNYSEVQVKDFLRKKTGNGGGYIHLEESGRSGSRVYKRYENVFSRMDQYGAMPVTVKKECYVENDQYTNGSHLSNKYDLEKTVEYPDYDRNEQILIQKLLNKGQPSKDLSVLQIQRLIDLAYSKVK